MEDSDSSIIKSFQGIKGVESISLMEESNKPQEIDVDSDEEEIPDFVGFALSQICPKKRGTVRSKHRKVLSEYYELKKEQTTNEQDIFNGMKSVYDTMHGTEGDLLGYSFNREDKLVHEKTGEGFKFIDQIHYDLLALAVTKYVQECLLSMGLQQIEIPFMRHHPGRGSKWSFIFASPDVFTNERLVILLVGSGKIQAGLWAQSLCINESLKSGSVIPYVEQIQERGWSVLILNPNINEGVPIASSPEAHLDYIWEHVVKETPPNTKIALVAHSYGGVCLMSLFQTQLDSVLSKLKAVAFTDSVHHINNDTYFRIPAKARELIKQSSVNWQASIEPLDTVLHEFNEYTGCKCVSAGTTSHPGTNAAAMESILKYFNKNFQSNDFKNVEQK